MDRVHLFFFDDFGAAFLAGADFPDVFAIALVFALVFALVEANELRAGGFFALDLVSVADFVDAPTTTLRRTSLAIVDARRTRRRGVGP